MMATRDDDGSCSTFFTARGSCEFSRKGVIFEGHPCPSVVVKLPRVSFKTDSRLIMKPEKKRSPLLTLCGEETLESSVRLTRLLNGARMQQPVRDCWPSADTVQLHLGGRGAMPLFIPYIPHF